MGSKSSIARLDNRIKTAVDRAIQEGRMTIDEIVRLINEMGGDASRSAVGRYKQGMEESMETFRATQGMAQVWAKKLEEEPGSPIAQLAQQVLGSVALHTVNSVLNAGESVPAGDLMFLCKALDHLARAEKTSADRELKIRAEVTKKAAESAVVAAKKQGMSNDAVAMIRKAIEEGARA